MSNEPTQRSPEPKRFAWPPRKAADVAAVAGPAEQDRPKPQRRVLAARPSLWGAIEETWLDVSARPLPQRAVELGWSVDDADDYCPRCGRSSRRFTSEGCDECRDIKLAWARMVRLGEYAGPLRTWVHEVKFTRWRRLGHDLGELLGEQLQAAYGGLDPSAFAAPPVLVPVPDSGLRRLVRGIDHTMVIARGIQAATGWGIVQPLRRKLGPSQVSVAPSERSANVARSFGLRSDSGRMRLSGRVVVVVDDVCTTGATMRACAKLVASACRKEGKDRSGEVWGAVLARTESLRPAERKGR